MRNLLFALFFVILHTPIVFAQSELYGVWTNLNFAKQLNEKFDFEADTELRTYDYLDKVDKIRIGGHLDYSLIKGLKFGLGYQFFQTYDRAFDNFQTQNRIHAALSYGLKFNNFSIALRERVYCLIKDNSNQLTGIAPSISDHWTWRNRLKISYSIPNFPIKPSAFAETFFALNGGNAYKFDQIRYNVSLMYPLNQHHAIDLFGIINSKLKAGDHYGVYILGVGYHLKW